MSTGRHVGKVALVTGGAGGIGRAIVEAYLADGARVALVDANAAAAETTASELGGLAAGVVGLACDVADYASVEATCQAAEAALGPIDILVNNAGISPKHEGRRADADAMAVEEWHRVVDVNLNGCFHMVRALSPGMKARGFGRIVNMSSVAGKSYLGMVGVHYSATKAALIGFTRHLAGEFGPFGVTVNALAPGRIDTPLMKTVSAEVNQAVIGETALRRLGSAAEVASACLFFTGPESTFVTGQVCDVAGGWMMT